MTNSFRGYDIYMIHFPFSTVENSQWIIKEALVPII